MNIDRMDLDEVGSPIALAARIHELIPDMSLPVPVEELCKLLDITSIAALETDGFEAALITDENKSSGAILHAQGRHPARTRFSIAHELGHFLIPSHRPTAASPFQCSVENLHSDTRTKDRQRRIEAEANRFAAHLLMPPNRVRAAILASDRDLKSLCIAADEFEVSKEAMARAWTDQHSEPVAVVIVRSGQVERFYRGKDFPWLSIRPGEDVPFGSIADTSSIEAGEFSEIEEVEPDVWISERDAEPVLAMTEQVLGQQAGYSIILLNAEIDEE